jgi:hypothetical protein
MSKAQPGPHLHTIDITLNADGTIGYNYPSLHVHRRDKVKWHCANKWIAVGFKLSPLKEGQKFSELDTISDKTIAEDAAFGTYEYVCSVSSGQQISLDHACPEIIVDPT